MAVIVYEDFKGVLPIASAYRLPANYAQKAENCNFERGSMEGIDDNTLQGTVQKATPAKIFKCGDKWESWTSWVNVVRSWIYDASSDRFYFTNGSQPSQMRESGINDTLLSGTASTTYDLGIDAPTGAPTLAKTDDGSPGSDVIATVAYVFTYLTSWGEESAPSPASEVLDIYADEYVTVTCPTPADERAASTLITKIRIYRVASGTAGAEYQFLTEQTIAGTTVAYDDRDGANYAITPDVELGEAISTENYDPPPAAMDGLISFSNGQMAGFVSNQVYLNEPFIPYAFPEEYIKLVESNVVGLGAIGSSLVVMTETHPYLATGTDPEGMILDRLNDGEKCVAERGIVSTPFGVLYPSPNGLIRVTQVGAGPVTLGLYTRDQWSELGPENFISYWYEGRYYAFRSGTNQGFIFCNIFSEDSLPYVITLLLSEYPAGYEVQVIDAYVDPETRILFLLILSADTNYYVLQYARSAEGIEYSWTGRKEFFDNNMSFGAGVILGATGEDEVIITENENTLITEDSDTLVSNLSGSGVAALRVTVDDVLVESKNVPVNGTPWRINPEVGRTWEFAFNNLSARIDKIKIATTMDELTPWA